MSKGYLVFTKQRIKQEKVLSDLVRYESPTKMISKNRGKMKSKRNNQIKKRRLEKGHVIITIPRIGDYSGMMTFKTDSSKKLFHKDIESIREDNPTGYELLTNWIKYRILKFMSNKDSDRLHKMPNIFKVILIFGFPKKGFEKICTKNKWNNDNITIDTLNKIFVNTCLRWANVVLKSDNGDVNALVNKFEKGYIDELSYTNKTISKFIKENGGKIRIFNPEYFLNYNKHFLK
jgi:hypothetical protein